MPDRDRPRDRLAGIAGQFGRYALAAAGPVGSAGSQLLLSLVLLHRLDTAAFGAFSFLLVASQFSWGVWSALFCAPLPVLASSGASAGQDGVRRAMFAACLSGAAGASVLFLCVALGVGADGAAAALFAGYSAVALLRWFGRARAYVAGQPVRTFASDLSYSGVLLAGTVLMWWNGRASLALAFGALLAGAVVGLLPFGRGYLLEQFVRVSPRDVPRYRAVWQGHSRWTLLGVLTTEATANAHVYLVTAIHGPAAYAGIAAAALLIRPITVAQNALGEFERVRMARQIGAGAVGAALRSVTLFRIAMGLAWAATLVAAAVLLAAAPRLVFPERYGLSLLATGGALWMAVAGVRLLRMPDSVFLQAAGAFRRLAGASVRSCGWSVAAVLATLLAAGPLWSIGGILIGELVFAAAIWRRRRDWLAEREGATA